MALPKLEGIVTIPSGSSVSVTETGGGGTAAVSLTAGTYSLSELCAHLASVLTSNGTLSGTYSCSVSDDSDTSTGKVTLSVTGITSFTLTWTDTTVRDALGYTATLTPTATSFLASNASPWIWLPNVGRSDGDLADGDQGDPIRQVAVNCAPDGSVYSWASSALRYETVIEFQNIRGYKALRSFETVTNESLQTFFETVVSKGIRFRYYIDRSDDTSYTEHVAKQGDAERYGLEPAIKGWRGTNSLWHWRCDTYAVGASTEDWTPLDLVPDYWIRADLGVTDAGSGAVSAWADQSGNGHTLAQATGANRPTQVASVINGQTIVRFGPTPSAKYMAFSTPWAQSSGAMTVLAVVRYETVAADYQILLQRSGATSPAIYLGYNPDFNKPTTYTSGGTQAIWGTALTDVTPYRITWTVNASADTMSVSVNGGTPVSVAAGVDITAGTWTHLGLNLGVQDLASDVAEVVILNRALTNDEETAWAAYTLSRYGV